MKIVCRNLIILQFHQLLLCRFCPGLGSGFESNHAKTNLKFALTKHLAAAEQETFLANEITNLFKDHVIFEINNFVQPLTILMKMYATGRAHRNSIYLLGS